MHRLLFLFGLSGLVWRLTGCQATAVAIPTTSPPLPTEIAATQVPSLPALDPAEIALGEAVYAAHCANCHGANLEGEAEWKIQNEDTSLCPLLAEF